MPRPAVEEPDIDRVMGRAGAGEDDDDDDNDDEFDFRQQRQQLKQRASAANRPAAGGPAEEAETEAAYINPHTAAICEACRQGDTQQLKQLLAKPGTLSLGCLGQTDAEGNAPLHAAARAGHAACIRLLAEARAGLDQPSGADGDGPTPLLLASRSETYGGFEALEALLEAGADANGGAAARDSATTPLLEVANRGPTSAVQRLLRANADPNARSGSGSTALHEAVFCEASDRVDLLLASKADPSLANGRGKTPLDVAAQLGHAEIVALFEQHEEEQEAAWRNQ